MSTPDIAQKIAVFSKNFHRASRITNFSHQMVRLAANLAEWSYEADLANKKKEDSVRHLITQLLNCSDILDS